MIDFNKQIKEDMTHDNWLASKLEDTDEECPICTCNTIVFDVMTENYWCENCCAWINLDLTNDN